MSQPTWITPAGRVLRTAATTTATALAGSTTIVVGSAALIEVGQWVTGSGINRGTTVLDVAGTTITLSAPTAAPTVGLYTFSSPVFIENTAMSAEFVATPGDQNNYVTYSILNGGPPPGNIVLTSTAGVAYLTGTIDNISVTSVYEFTIRASEFYGGVEQGISDRSFTIEVVDNTNPIFTTRSGVLGNQGPLDPDQPAANITDITSANVATAGTLSFTNGIPSITGNVTQLLVDTAVQVVGPTAGYNISNGSVYWIHGVTPTTFTLKSSILSTAPAIVPDFTDNTLRLEIVGGVMANISPQDTGDWGIANGSMVYFGGLAGVEELNGQPFYAGNVSTNTLILYRSYAGGVPLYPYTEVIGTYTSGTGTVAPVVRDCAYFEAQITADMDDPVVPGEFTLVDGNLPAGLELSPSGKITGYPLPPVYGDDPLAAVSQFTVKITSTSGSATANFQIPVINQELAWSANSVLPFPGRAPAVLNNQPLSTPLPSTPYYSYYYTGDTIGTFTEDNRLIFKFIGYNWNSTQSQGSDFGLSYTITGLSAGPTPATDVFSARTWPNATGYTTDGWINGVLSNLSAAGLGIKTYTGTVEVSNISDVDGSTLTTGPINFEIRVTGLFNPEVTWVTPENLGQIATGETSALGLEAIFDPSITDIIYELVDGELPPILELWPDGKIVGKVAVQPGQTIRSPGTITTYTFTVEAYSQQYQAEGISSTRTFTVDVEQTASNPWDNLYMVALLNEQQQTTIDQLIGSLRYYRGADIYRLDDPNWGITQQLKYVHMIGVSSKNTDEFYAAYTEAIKRNHYYKNLVLGSLQTARALDSDGQVLYEVVYSPIIDNLENSLGVSVSKSIYWPYPIIQDGRAVNRELYPNSLTNMRAQIESTINTVDSGPQLPTWMNSLQPNGVVPGFVPAWVVCYTKPGAAAGVLTWINNWLSTAGVALNDFDFEIDRFDVDRSLSWTWGAVQSYAWPSIVGTIRNGNTTITLNSVAGLEINGAVQFEILEGPATLGPGTITATVTSTAVTGVGTSFSGAMVGQIIYNSEFQQIGQVQSVGSTTTLTLASTAAIPVTAGEYWIETGTTNILTMTDYWITELRANYLASGVLTNSIKIRPDYYGNINNIITPTAGALVSVLSTPLSATVGDDQHNSTILFDQQTIIRP